MRFINSTADSCLWATHAPFADVSSHLQCHLPESCCAMLCSGWLTTGSEVSLLFSGSEVAKDFGTAVKSLQSFLPETDEALTKLWGEASTSDWGYSHRVQISHHMVRIAGKCSVPWLGAIPAQFKHQPSVNCFSSKVPIISQHWIWMHL